MHVVYYYVLIKLPGWEIGAVLALHQPLGRAGRQRAHWQHMGDDLCPFSHGMRAKTLAVHFTH